MISRPHGAVKDIATPVSSSCHLVVIVAKTGNLTNQIPSVSTQTAGACQQSGTACRYSWCYTDTGASNGKSAAWNYGNFLWWQHVKWFSYSGYSICQYRTSIWSYAKSNSIGKSNPDASKKSYLKNKTMWNRVVAVSSNLVAVQKKKSGNALFIRLPRLVATIQTLLSLLALA